MSFENLKKIYEFSEQYSNQNYWEKLFQHQGLTQLNLADHASITSNNRFPACDSYVKNNKLFIEVELPGIDMNNVSIKMEDGNTLIISGEYASLQENCAYYLKERQNRHFLKKIFIPFPIIEKDRKTHFTNGLLTIHFPIH
ncbi:MAG: Hsp20/alpha crystallin family protein [Bacillus sp. (in: firmicutes)]